MRTKMKYIFLIINHNITIIKAESCRFTGANTPVPSSTPCWHLRTSMSSELILQTPKWSYGWRLSSPLKCIGIYQWAFVFPRWHTFSKDCLIYCLWYYVFFIVRHFLNTAINRIIPGCLCNFIVLKVLNRSVPGGQKISLTPASIFLVTSSNSFEILRK